MIRYRLTQKAIEALDEIGPIQGQVLTKRDAKKGRVQFRARKVKFNTSRPSMPWRDRVALYHAKEA